MADDQTAMATDLRDAIAAMLGAPADSVGEHDNLIELGMDSLTMMRLAGKWRQAGLDIGFAELAANPTLSAWRALIDERVPGGGTGEAGPGGAAARPEMLPEVDDSVPFELARMQHAYWVGRDEGQLLGGVGAHFYCEFDGPGLDPERLEGAVRALFDRHPMLRVRVRDDGLQQILPVSPWPGFAIHDLRDLTDAQRAGRLEALRDRLTHRRLDVGAGQVFDVQLSLLPGGCRTHIDLEMLVSDAMSFRILLADLAHLYECDEPLPAIGFSYPRYLATRSARPAAAHRSAREYWRGRLAELPPSPRLPLTAARERTERPRAIRRHFWLPPERRQGLVQRAHRRGVTPAMAVATAFAEVIAAWSTEPRFLLNLPLFGREQYHPDVDRIVGDFTNSVLLAVDTSVPASFVDRARSVQERFQTDAVHSEYSGVEVLRDLSRENRGGRVLAPVVFTSALNVGELFAEDFQRRFGQPVWIISQVPQVWLDAQVSEVQGGLLVNWDARELAFPEGVLDAMFGAFQRLVEVLAGSDTAWEGPVPALLPDDQRSVRERLRERTAPAAAAPVHRAFFDHAERCPRDTALIGDGRAVSYGELALHARRVAGLLVGRGAATGQTVGVAATAGADRVAAVLGVLAAGCAPALLGAESPAHRRPGAAGPAMVLAGEGGAEGWAENVPVLALADAAAVEPLEHLVSTSPHGAAYVRHAVGSDAVPRWAAASHRTIANLLMDLAARIDLGTVDRVLTLSPEDVDLCGFGILGPLSAGGAALIAAPDHAVELLRDGEATVLVCLPEMLDEALETVPDGLPESLRAVLAVTPDLPAGLAARLHDLRSGCRIVGLGGADEAGAPATAHEITPGHEGPAPGVPLRGIGCRVVDHLGRDRPDWVAGELLVRDPATETWRRTGDRARVQPGGSIAFADSPPDRPVIRGRRVELGAVESVLESDPRVAGAVALAGPGGRPMAAVVPNASAETAVSVDGRWLAALERLEQPPAASEDGASTAMLEARLVETLLANVLILVSGLVPEPTDFDALADHWGVAAGNRRTYRLWLDWLAGRDVLTADGAGSYAVGQRFDEVAGLGRWAGLSREAAGTHLAGVVPQLSRHAAQLPALMRSEAGVLALLEDPVLAPDALLDVLPGMGTGIVWLARSLRGLSGALGRPVEVAELGARTGRTAARLCAELSAEQVTCTLLDSSPAMLSAARDRLAGSGHWLDYRLLAGDVVPDDLRHRFDVVLANNSLHLFGDAAAGPALAAALLRPGGLLLALEQVELSPIALVTAALPARGFEVADPIRRRPGSPLLSPEAWCALLQEHSFERPEAVPSHGGELLCLRARRLPAAGLVDVAALREALGRLLPASLVPDRVVVMTRADRDAGGRIDREAVRAALTADRSGPASEEFVAPRGQLERTVASLWAELLGVDRSAPSPLAGEGRGGGEVVFRIGRTSSFFALGGDSLLATRLLTRLRAAGVHGAEIGRLFASPMLANFATTLRLGPAEDAGATLVSDPVHRHEPFPPTEVQRAYWLGRAEGFTLGGVGCHFYREYDVEDLDVGRLEAAVNRLVARHEMLRAIFDERGDQRILQEVPRFVIRVVDVGPDPEAAFAEQRETMSHHVFDPSTWPLFAIGAVRSGRRSRLGIGVDNIVLDALSVLTFYAELAALYADPDAALPPLGVSFRDCVLGAVAEPAAVAAAREYWTARLPELPPAPQLPLAADPAEVARPRFTRRQARIDASRWRVIQDRAREHGLTPSTVLLAAFAEVLGAWSARADLTLNITLFDRREVHPDVNNVLGDFTSLMLVAYQPAPGEGWLARARRLQEQMWRDLDHREVSGIWVLRELARLAGEPEVAMPVVFTSALGIAGAAAVPPGPPLTHQVWGVSQTPQVWLDHQVIEVDGGVSLYWDAVEALFPAGLLDAMFGSYLRLLDWLVMADWAGLVPDLLPAAQRRVRDSVNATSGPEPDRLLHGDFFRLAAEVPGRVALLWGDGGSMTYGELAGRALRLATVLGEHGVECGEPVAVTLPKGPDQVVAVLGVLAAGGAYVPVGADQPPVRRDRIHCIAGTRLVVTDQLEGLPPPSGGDGPRPVLIGRAATAVPAAGPAEVPVDELAYVIFTSGSTGEPKGVEITHRSAMNTVADINERCGVGPADRVLAVSALDFDLSVYDLFGLLSAGGAVVLIEEEARRDARRWLELVGRHQVTIWNTVPALLDMLLIVAEQERLPGRLRLVLVSGDWVGLDLPGRLAAQRPDCRFVALGGATEASIWSNFFEVERVDPSWSSIPYGHPLRNQRFRVVDGEGHHRPDWVAGELWIGGAGVARGYRGAAANTSQFVVAAGDRWYRTGDLGRYWPDGTLEFLGRLDQQVKIRGHRIELGEIEAALEDDPGVEHALVTVTGEGSGRRLVAAVVPAVVTGSHADVGQDLPAAPVPPAASAVEAGAVEAVMARLLGLDRLIAGPPRDFSGMAAGFDLAPDHVATVQLWLRWLVGRDVLVQDAGTFGAGPRLTAALEGWSPSGGAEDLLVEQVHRRLVERLDDYREILAGRLEVLVLLDDPVLAPERLAAGGPDSDAALMEIARELAAMAGAASRPVDVVELDGRSGVIAQRLLGALSPEQVRYTLLDPAAAMVAAAGRRLEGLPHDTACDRMSAELVPDRLRYRFDAVVVHNGLHRYRDPGHGPHLAGLLARRGGAVLAVEPAELTPIGLMTAALLDRGYVDLDRERRRLGSPMLPGARWAELFVRAGFTQVRHGRAGSSGLTFLRARRPTKGVDLDPGQIRDQSAARVPAYMVPERVEVLPWLPLSANGKVDRAAVARLVDGGGGGGGGADAADPPQGELEQAVAAIWADLLGAAIGRGQSFFALGGDSLLATRFIETVRQRFGVALSLRGLLAAPTVRDSALALARERLAGDEVDEGVL